MQVVGVRLYAHAPFYNIILLFIAISACFRKKKNVYLFVARGYKLFYTTETAKRMESEK